MSQVLHPGKHFAATLKEREITAYECAAAIGVRPPRLYDLAKCKTAITPPLALRLSRYLGGSAERWMQLQTRYDLALAEKKLHSTLPSIERHRRSRR
jgi:addiction module HigA family antidote